MGVFKQKYVFWALIVLFLGGAAFLSFGFVPVLKVEGKTASYSNFLKVYGALKTFDGISRKNLTSAQELKRQALSEIAGDMLLDEFILETDPSLEARAGELMSQAMASSTSLEAAAKGLYGLSVDDFKEIVLLPQAKRDALSEKFRNDPEKLDNDWNNFLKSAEVEIYYPGFYWERGEVKTK